MNERRTVVAFLVAPLAMPLFSACLGMLLGGAASNVPYRVIVTVIAAVTVVSYMMSLLVGIPTYQFLVARQMTAFHVAPLAGAFVGFVSYSLVKIGIGGAGLATWIDALLTLMFASVAALAGAVGGVVFWLIARSDRQTLPESPSHDQQP